MAERRDVLVLARLALWPPIWFAGFDILIKMVWD